MSLDLSESSSSENTSKPHRTVAAATQLLLSLRAPISDLLKGEKLRVPLDSMDIMPPERRDQERAHVMWTGPAETASGERFRTIARESTFLPQNHKRRVTPERGSPRPGAQNIQRRRLPRRRGPSTEGIPLTASLSPTFAHSLVHRPCSSIAPSSTRSIANHAPTPAPPSLIPPSSLLPRSSNVSPSHSMRKLVCVEGPLALTWAHGTSMSSRSVRWAVGAPRASMSLSRAAHCRDSAPHGRQGKTGFQNDDRRRLTLLDVSAINVRICPRAARQASLYI